MGTFIRVCMYTALPAGTDCISRQAGALLLPEWPALLSVFFLIRTGNVPDSVLILYLNSGI